MTKTPVLCRGLAGLILAAAAAVTSLPAANGDIPIYQATTITQPGRYVVTRDITTQGDVIVIQTPGVTLDLNGHTIKSVAGSGVVFDIPAQAGLIGPNYIVGGRIGGGDTGIKGVNLPAVQLVIVEKVGIVMPMFNCIDFPGSRLQVRGSVLQECGRDGIRMTGNGTGVIEVEGTTITDVQGSGVSGNAIEGAVVRGTTIRRFGLDTSADSGGVRMIAPGKIGLSVLDSVLADGSARGAGLLLEMAGGIGPIDIVGNAISGNGLSGIELIDGVARITGNTLVGNLRNGITVDAAGIVTPSMISGNSILDNLLHGASILGGSVRFNGNTDGGNGGDGVSVAGARSIVENNYFEGNTGAGIRFLNGTGHAYRGNFARGNTGGEIQDPFNNTDAGGNVK